MSHTCDAIVISCIDFRFQPFLEKWINKNLGEKNYDRVCLAGGVFDLKTILSQVEISKRLHQIKKVILINHEDCGAYGEEGTLERHTQDLANAKKQIQTSFPNLDVETYYLHLDGTFLR